MAEILPDFDPSLRGVKGKYPWSEWTDGQARRIRHGEDYELSEEGMRNALRTRATRERMRCIIRRVEGERALDFQFWTPEENGR